MRIEHAKQVAFLEKVLNATKQDIILWERVSSHNNTVHAAFPYDKLDSEGAFRFKDEKFKGVFWIAMRLDGRVIGVIGQNENYLINYDDDDAKIGLLLTRIYFMIFDYYPSAEKVIDAYLNDE